jgi:hypothetical protein
MGWYLMWPPHTVTLPTWLHGSCLKTDLDGDCVQEYAPFSKWLVHKAFATPAECNAAQVADVQDAIQKTQQGKPDEADLIAAESAIKLQCIATDDPRLKP